MPMVASRGGPRAPVWAARADTGLATFEMRASVARVVSCGCADNGSASWGAWADEGSARRYVRRVVTRGPEIAPLFSQGVPAMTRVVSPMCR